MKKPNKILVLSILFLQPFAGASAFAARNPRVHDVVVSSHSSSERSSRGAGGGFGIGMASFSSLGNVTGAAFPGLSLAIDTSNSGMIQAMVGITTVTPFAFGFGAEYKHLVSGTKAGGFHLGGGLALGTTGPAGVANFFMNFNALAGLQFVLPNVNNIQFDFDMGFQAGFNAATATAVLALGGMSAVYGMSIHYFF